MSDPILLAQITDTHLLAQTTADLRGCNVWNSFNTVLQSAMQHNPHGLLLTGDLAEQGEAEAYEHLVDAIAPLQIPIYWIPGNHDNLPTLQQAFQQLPSSQGLTAVDLGTWQLLLLNSVLPQAKFGEGHLANEQLQRLHIWLKKNPHKPTLIALHHHPVPVNIDWVDQMQIQNANNFLALLERFPNVKLVVFGHIHHEFHLETAKGIAFYGCPSSSLQVTTSEISEERPGFRLFRLYKDGKHKTDIRRVKLEKKVPKILT